jgi:sphingolipid delta-4 desaturase
MYKIPNQWEIINIITVIVSDIIIYKYIGANGLLWLIIGTLSSLRLKIKFKIYIFINLLSIHPSAGHIIAEHYEF